MRAPIATMILGAALTLAGCVAPDSVTNENIDEYVLVFSVKDDYDAFVESAQPLADWVEAETGVKTTILPVGDESATITALANGQAHAAFMDGGAAWIGWTTFGLEAIAADQNGDGRTHYVANAWVLADSDIETVEDLRGLRSCHTGELKSAGMLAPMGYLIGNDYIDMEGLDLNDIASLQEARQRFFSDSQIGGDYIGALQCLSVGNGDVAFIKDNTWDLYCAGDDAPTWCLDEDAYRQLPDTGFATVPSHPVMVPGDLPAEHRQALQDALLALNDDEEGRDILANILKTPGITAVDTEDHLGSYGDVLEDVPGIVSYLNAKKLK